MRLIISIDIGEKNLGWSTARFEYEGSTSERIDIKDITFESGVYDFKSRRGDSIVMKRIFALQEWCGKVIRDDDELEAAIVERQVGMRNEVAMQLMYAVASMLAMKTSNIVIFDPKRKFTVIGQQYCTKNKQHKKQSIINMKRMLSSRMNAGFEQLELAMGMAKKQDDIADSFNQLIVQMVVWDKLVQNLDDIKQIYNDKKDGVNKDKDDIEGSDDKAKHKRAKRIEKTRVDKKKIEKRSPRL